jgi:uncharacterized protein
LPLIESDYKPPWYWDNQHLQTIVPNRLRRVQYSPYVIEPIALNDEVIDVYWSRVGSDTAIIVAHGLGGHVHRPYVRGMIRTLNRAGFDACAWHVWNTDRDESPHIRHGGWTEGLRNLVARLSDRYARIGLVGFSLGGNVVLKYLGEERETCGVVGAVAISVPCDLENACYRISEPVNRVYLNSFLKSLKRNIRRKAAVIPDRVSVDGLDRIRNLIDFDNRYTAPLNGFVDAHDYYGKASSLSFLPDISTSTLLINAQNDPFLTESCYPTEVCESSRYLSLETPESGGHVGFPMGRGRYWSEERTVTFLRGL